MPHVRSIRGGPRRPPQGSQSSGPKRAVSRAKKARCVIHRRLRRASAKLAWPAEHR